MRELGIATSVCLALLAGCSNPHPEAPQFPPPAEVEKVTTTVFGTVSKQPDLAEFEIPSAFVPDVLRVLSPPEYHALPPAHEREVVAVLHVTCRDGRVLVVELVYFGNGPVQYTLQGVPCRRQGTYSDLTPDRDVSLSEVVTFEAFLRAIQRADTRKARDLLAHLDKAAGR